MPGAAADDEDDTLDLTEEMELDDADQDDTGDEGDDESQAGDGADDDAGEEETVVSFVDEQADEEDTSNDSSVIRNLRQQLREAKRNAAELSRLAEKPKAEIGPKPTLSECGYDEEAYDAALEAWRAKKDDAEAGERQREEEGRRAQESWTRDLTSYEAKKVNLGVADFDEAEETVKTTLNLVQQAVIVKAATDPAALIYALGRSDAKLAELAKFEDPIKMAAAVARMEGSVKIMKRRKGPAIDKPEKGSGRMPGGSDKKLEELEKKAERSGDRTELVRYKRQLKDRDKK